MRVEVLRDTQANMAESAALAGRKRMRSTRAVAIPGAVWCFLLLTLAFETSRPVFAADPTPSEVLVAPTQDSLLSGADWRLGSFAMDEGESRSPFAANFDDHAFRTVAVPGEVQLQIGLKGMDRYYQSRELSLVNKREWWYRKHFVAPPGYAGKLNRLVFDGVDYFTTVWLNGDKLGSHEGAYVSFSFDVSSKLKYGSDNVLVLKVTAPWVPRERGYLEYLKGEWTMSDPSNVMRFPFPPFVLGPYWDGIPAAGNAVFPMGLWRDVHLLTSGSLVISDAFVYTTSLNNDGSATLDISGAIRNYSGETHKAEVKLQISPDNFKAETIDLPPQTVSAKPGESTFEIETVLRDPRLWWTWDTGEQNLYRLTVAIASVDSAGEDHRDTVFGIRTISRKDDMSYWLNGKRVFLKGAWYPIADYYGSLPTRTTYRKDLELYRAANLNHLVAFTTVEKPDFYDLCDRLGILDFFEYPFSQFGPEEVLDYSNPRRAEFVRESLSQLRQITITLRNHPSIIEWAPFAEAHEKGGKWGVLDLDLEKYGYGEYSDTIGKMVAELDPGTLYQPSFCDLGEQHFWMANSGMGTEGGYNEHFDASTSFVSEYGSIAMPALETLQKDADP